MTGSRSNVVPFERPAAYWAVRARKHYSPRKLPDAARLMRKALEKSGDPGLALELSENTPAWNATPPPNGACFAPPCGRA